MSKQHHCPGCGSFTRKKLNKKTGNFICNYCVNCGWTDRVYHKPSSTHPYKTYSDRIIKLKLAREQYYKRKHAEYKKSTNPFSVLPALITTKNNDFKLDDFFLKRVENIEIKMPE